MPARVAVTLRIALSTCFVLTTATVTGSPRVEAATRDLALGISIYDGLDLGMLDSFRASIGGQRVATWTIWRGWNPQTTGRFPTAAANGARKRGAVPMIWWEPYWCCDPGNANWTHPDIVAGVYDDYIRDFARDAKDYGHTVLLRYAHQSNSDYLPWAWDTSETDDFTIDGFKDAWRHVHGIFDDVGATNVKWVWSVATQTCAGDGKNVAFTVTNCMRRPLGYPGDAWVDYMAFTWENWGKAAPSSVVASGPWVSMIDGFKPVVRRLKRTSGKPIIAIATASAPDGGNKARWIRNGYRKVQTELPRVVAIMWLNVDLSGSPTFHRDWSLHGRPLRAYAAIAAMPEFQGRIRRR